MHRSQPFARAIALFALISAAAGDTLKLASIPEYRSHGKGVGKHSGKKWGSPSSRTIDPHTGRQKENGEREVARRRRQIASGMLRVS